MKRKSSLYIKDIIDAIEKIEKFVENMSFDDFAQDDKTSSAVVWKLGIIGEAVKQLPLEIRDRFSEVPWSAMAKTRDKIIHFYHGIDYEIVWKIIREELPALRHALSYIHKRIEEEEK